ncbi:MAG: ABC transporter ATP-binding protein [Solirubrobacterales bacterium]|nr:ABC transporter ATP-binding protein [Solirubrobacterales bacterium]MBV9473606.1 ABC transporter ATP-binding protein [Solirubrobacterales bacterium]
MSTEPITVAPSAATGSDPALLEVEGLNVSYGHVRAVRGVSFSVAEHSGMGIIGANGAGKTSTLKALLRLIPAQVERVEFDGRSLAGRKPHRIVELGIGYVPEGRHVFPGLSVRKNLLLGAYRHRWDDAVQGRLDRIHDLFPVLKQFDKRLAGALSGGQQQMLAIGRALMSDPRLLVLDEPSMGLAPVIVDEIVEALGELRRVGMSILLVEQNAKVTFALTDYCQVLSNGRQVKHGSSAELRQDPEIRRIYLGI